MKLAAGVLAILVIPVVLFAVDPGRETALHSAALAAYAGAGLVLLVVSFVQRPTVRPDRSLDERAMDRRLAVGALMAAALIGIFGILSWSPLISLLGVAWSLVWLIPFTRHVSVTTRVLINRDVKTVFGFLADMRNDPQYMPDIVSVEKITDGDIGPGTQFRSTVRMADGRTFQGVDQIVEMEGGRRITDSVVSGSRPNFAVTTFDPIGGATQITFRFVSEVSYPSALLGAGVLRWAVTGQMRRRRMEAWARLKQLLESRPAT